jgi:hypothetical protein
VILAADATIAMIVVFLMTAYLAFRHMRQRRRALTEVPDPQRWADAGGRLDTLTVGDLVTDLELRTVVLRIRSDLVAAVTTEGPRPAPRAVP